MSPSNNGMAEPPEGAIAGESVPRENEADDRYEAALDELVGEMKAHPAYSHLNDEEIREKAAEKLKIHTHTHE